MRGNARQAAATRRPATPARKAAPAAPARKVVRKAASGKKALPVIKAPEEYRSAFYVVNLKTEVDGLLAHAIKVTRVQGRLDTAPDRARRDVSSYDLPTVYGILSRFSARTFVNKEENRLRPSTAYRVTLRVNRTADNTIKVLFKGVAVAVTNGKGRIVAKELAKDDAAYRRLRGATRFLAPAFRHVQMPPKLTTRRGASEEDEE